MPEAGEPGRSRVELAPLENGAPSMPTAVFYNAEDATRQFGRAAIAAYVDGHEGRLMRSIKSILGSDLMDEATELPGGLQVRYIDVVIAYLRQLREVAPRRTGRFPSSASSSAGRSSSWTTIRSAMAGRRTRCSAPPVRPDSADVQFQFEPIAAALDYESRLRPDEGERLVLVADIGGGTSDFSVVRASAKAHARVDRPLRCPGQPWRPYGGNGFRSGG